MKLKLLSASLLLTLALSASGGLYTFSGPFTDNGSGAGVIPDNSTIGLADAQVIGGLDSSIASVILTFTLQGGVATDLTGYLRLGNLSTSPAYDFTTLIQAQNLSSGTPATYTVDASTLGSTFDTLNPNNTWTLYFADGVNGDQTTLTGWSLDITAVPEPVNVALGIFGAGFIGVVVLRFRKSSKATSQSPKAVA